MLWFNKKKEFSIKEVFSMALKKHLKGKFVDFNVYPFCKLVPFEKEDFVCFYTRHDNKKHYGTILRYDIYLYSKVVLYQIFEESTGLIYSVKYLSDCEILDNIKKVLKKNLEIE